MMWCCMVWYGMVWYGVAWCVVWHRYSVRIRASSESNEYSTRSRVCCMLLEDGTVQYISFPFQLGSILITIYLLFVVKCFANFAHVGDRSD